MFRNQRPVHRQPEGDDKVVVLGVRFDRLTRAEVLAIIKRAFGSRRALKVYIANAHTVNLACARASYLKVLNGADLLLNDGLGVQIGSRVAGKPLLDNMVGTDLIPEMCERAAMADISVFLLGGQRGIAERAAEGLRRRVDGVRIAGVHHGYFSEIEDPIVADKINRSGAGILLVAFGNPLQELWISRNAHRLRCDLCIGVGGLFDHLSGRLRRAPFWLRRLGMEWAFILMFQPHKWRRYLLGNPLFLFRLLAEKLRSGR